jgi:hypothetical protein
MSDAKISSLAGGRYRRRGCHARMMWSDVDASTSNSSLLDAHRNVPKQLGRSLAPPRPAHSLAAKSVLVKPTVKLRGSGAVVDPFRLFR